MATQKKSSRKQKKKTSRQQAAKTTRTQQKGSSASASTGSKKRAQPSEVEQIEALSELMERRGLAELEWEEGSSKNRKRIVLRTKEASNQNPFAQSAWIPASAAQAQEINQTSLLQAKQGTQASEKPGEGSSQENRSSDGTQKGTQDTGKNQRPSNQKEVVSPLVGTFYRSPSPGAEPYVREDKQVKRGDVLCIVEAMKLMNEIESEYDGRIVSILVENGQPVQYGEPLFIIET